MKKMDFFKKFKWLTVAILGVVFLFAGELLYWTHANSLEYIDGNVLNLPYINQWNDDDLIDSPWNNIQFHTGLMFRSLFLADSSFENVESDIAKSCTVSNDGLVYTITLNADQLWSDREIITTEDVKFSIESILRAQTANGLYTAAFAKISGYNEFIQNPENGLYGIEIISDTSMKITLDTTQQ